jgi:hypothetical protein
VLACARAIAHRGLFACASATRDSHYCHPRRELMMAYVGARVVGLSVVGDSVVGLIVVGVSVVGVCVLGAAVLNTPTAPPDPITHRRYRSACVSPPLTSPQRVTHASVPMFVSERMTVRLQQRTSVRTGSATASSASQWLDPQS